MPIFLALIRMTRLISNWFNPAILITLSSGVFLISGCSSSSDSGDMSQMHHDSHSGMNHGNPEENPNPENSTETTQSQLTVPPEIAANQPITLEIQITDSAGKPISQFDIFQEKLLHAIAISNDLQFYNHIHPEYQGNGKFTTTATLPKPGEYTIFLDYKPTGQSEQVSLVTVSIPGTPQPALLPDLTRSKTIEETSIELSLSPPTLQPNQEVMVQFNLKDAKGKPIELQPYLGERGHLVIVKKSNQLTETSYLHSHAMKESSSGKVQFHTQFSGPGQYKMWGQFNRDGKILTADFWVEVSP